VVPDSGLGGAAGSTSVNQGTGSNAGDAMSPNCAPDEMVYDFAIDADAFSA